MSRYRIKPFSLSGLYIHYSIQIKRWWGWEKLQEEDTLAEAKALLHSLQELDPYPTPNERKKER